MLISKLTRHLLALLLLGCAGLSLLAPSAKADDSANASAPMTQDRLHELIVDIATDVEINGNLVGFTFNGVKLLCVSDVDSDRMRIISAISELTDLDGEQVILALAANFHTALDVRYALSDGLIYAAYIHPLSPLTPSELASAIRQVAAAQQSFGSDYSSGELFFSGQ